MKPTCPVLFVCDGPLPGSFPRYRTITARNADEACRMIRTDRPTAVVVAASPELVPIYVSRIRGQTPQPIVAVIPNEPREAIKAINAGAYDATVFGTLAQALDAAVADGLRILEGRPERLGPYELVSTIGRGSMATVYRAVADGREVALKVLFPELYADHEFVERFEREARSASTLTHPNLAAVYAHGRARWRLWMAMELVHGRPLDAMLKIAGRLEPPRALHIGRQIALGLGYAHQQGFVHRDIKPANIVVDESDVVKIMDFGLIKSTAGDEPAITRRDEFVGTIAYAAPEQVRSRPCDGRTDLYALGVLLFEMVCGRRPFTGGDHLSLLRAKEGGALPYSVTDLNPACPPAVQAIIDRLMRPNPADRFPDAAALVQAIDAAA